MNLDFAGGGNGLKTALPRIALPPLLEAVRSGFDE